MAEDFKLASGTWVSVGTLRVELVSPLAPLVQDVVITGHDRDEIGVLVFASAAGRGAAARGRCTPRCGACCASCAPKAPARRSARRARWCWPSRPSADAGEITDKGYINQRAVLTRRAAEVARLHADAHDPEVVRLA